MDSGIDADPREQLRRVAAHILEVQAEALEEAYFDALEAMHDAGFWRGDPATQRALAARLALTGCKALFEESSMSPFVEPHYFNFAH